MTACAAQKENFRVVFQAFLTLQRRMENQRTHFVHTSLNSEYVKPPKNTLQVSNMGENYYLGQVLTINLGSAYHEDLALALLLFPSEDKARG